MTSSDLADPSHAGVRTVLVLGSTGSIGTQALDVATRNPDLFRVSGIAASGSDPAALAAQAIAHQVDAIAVIKPTAVEDVQLAIYTEAQRRGYAMGRYRMPRIFAGAGAVLELIDAITVDVVLNGMPGSAGLAPTLRALGTGASVALANKESLIAGGPLVLDAAAPGQLVPVDSEHSALAQALRGGRAEEVERLVLTASGGPFRGRSRAELAEVTVEQALAHPTWQMGPVVTVNSATMMNKSLELIEAQLLFDVPSERIDVAVHPQSIVHSMVTFTDGSTLAQASPPDMRLPIALALNWPRRVPGAAPACRWDTATEWTFEPLDGEAFPAVELARHAARVGGCVPAVLNAANEEMVAAFLRQNTSFTSIVDTVSEVVSVADGWHGRPRDIDDVLAAEEWARARATELNRQGRD
ncbi:1-deoxy-D-xylulose-5-phosphate reductoisomerase [Haloechinothrix sp. YIM 98757]|uniref:1-deoxy-D-xylulose 5-phosphate reductoisomerase n=1 Tax=Haloechinothrix aidingensis TaxID=2752311 RepID=A0A838AG52_9PSEU|nr:1-deoxy-D-xylulose-5-phosphate reductoisomerase [Haloechinothrix aidingensis]MBA0128222.1 1-deoxy-D-xylulose-5-phosphate reductoisomerase [Haloechinothrix aidingensis]